ncbi:MAG: hypothetical protein WBZ36_12330, partial [Candidatus Nitrosopolaris sp.]
VIYDIVQKIRMPAIIVAFICVRSLASTKTGVQLLIGMFSFHWRNNNKNATVDTRLRKFGVSRHILSGIGDEINGPTSSNIC